MSTTQLVLEGTVKLDGSLELDSKLDLPPGRVQVIVQPLAEAPNNDPFWKMMKGIWAARMAGGHVPRTKQEINAEIDLMRKEAEEEMQKVKKVKEKFRLAHQRAEKAPGRKPTK